MTVVSVESGELGVARVGMMYDQIDSLPLLYHLAGPILSFSHFLVHDVILDSR